MKKNKKRRRKFLKMREREREREREMKKPTKFLSATTIGTLEQNTKVTNGHIACLPPQ